MTMKTVVTGNALEAITPAQGVESPLGTRQSTPDFLPMQDAMKIEAVPPNNGPHIQWRKRSIVTLPA